MASTIDVRDSAVGFPREITEPRSQKTKIEDVDRFPQLRDARKAEESPIVDGVELAVSNPVYLNAVLRT